MAGGRECRIAVERVLERFLEDLLEEERQGFAADLLQVVQGLP